MNEDRAEMIEGLTAIVHLWRHLGPADFPEDQVQRNVIAIFEDHALSDEEARTIVRGSRVRKRRG